MASVAFEDMSEQEEFYTTIGYDYVRVPYACKVIKCDAISEDSTIAMTIVCCLIP